MLRSISGAILAIITLLSISEYVNAEDWEYVNAEDWAILDIYDDTPFLLIPGTDSIDLTLKKSGLPDYKKREKALGKDLDQFSRDSLVAYTFIWIGRTYQVPGNTKKLFTTPLPIYLKYISGWQGCDGVKSRRGLCSPRRRSFLNPPLLDGDSFRTNFIHHPIVGMSYYLYYRAIGYDRTASSFGSFLHSTLFEYTIEAWQQPPSFNDVILTPGMGVPMGIVVEEISNRLAKSDSQFLRALSYLVNPTRVLVPDGGVAWQNFRSIGFRFNWY